MTQVKIIDVEKLRNEERRFVPGADIDSSFTFIYDETNNIKKFRLRDGEFNTPFQSNFVLGGLVFEGEEPDLKPLFSKLGLQKSVTELKLKHLAKGDFESCLGSKKMAIFFHHIRDLDIYLHYSSINILYYSLVDIVDSAVCNSDIALELGLEFSRFMKTKLYGVAKKEVEQVTHLFYRFGYPNIEKKYIANFIGELTDIFECYEDDLEYHVGLVSLKQILKASKEKGSLPFLEGGESLVLIDAFHHFYMRPLYLFKNSKHVFDQEISIEGKLSEYEFQTREGPMRPYFFVNSKDHTFVQACDVVVGFLGKLTNFVNTLSLDGVVRKVKSMSAQQLETLDLYLDIYSKSLDRNYAFIHSVDSVEEMRKINVMQELRGK